MQPRSNKRQKELARAERRQEKDAERERRKKERADRPQVDGEDPDIAGIVPGPQPRLPEFEDAAQAAPPPPAAKAAPPPPAGKADEGKKP